MKKEKFEIYLPMHLRRLRMEIKWYIKDRKAAEEGLLKKFINKVHKGK